MPADGIALRLDPLTVALTAMAGFCFLLALYLAQRQKLEALVRVSIYDPLTGLVGGRYLDAELWPVRIRGRAPLAVLYVDLDRLKPTNDLLGHAAGDRLIIQAAEVLRGSVRRGVDDVCRLHSSGDEFLIVLSCPSEAQAEIIAASVLGRLDCASISASVGVAFTASPDHGLRAALREQAEKAMYAAKRRGGGCYVLAGPEAAADGPTQPLTVAPSERDAAPEPIDDADQETQPRRVDPDPDRVDAGRQAVPEPIDDAAAPTQRYPQATAVQLVVACEAG